LGAPSKPGAENGIHTSYVRALNQVSNNAKIIINIFIRT